MTSADEALAAKARPVSGEDQDRARGDTYTAYFPIRELGSGTIRCVQAFNLAFVIKETFMASHPDTADQPDTPRNRGDDDAPHLSPATPAEDQRTILLNEIAWGAVLAGVVVALVTQLLLNMLGLGIGIATLDPGTGDNPSATSLSIGAGIWWTLSGILASLAGGYAAGTAVRAAEGGHRRLARPYRLGLHYAGDLLPAQLDRGRRARRRLQHGQRRARRPWPHRGGHRRRRGTGPVAGGRPDGRDRDVGARRQRRQRSRGSARCRGHRHARGAHRRPGPGAGGARAGRAGACPGAEHPDRGGSHARSPATSSSTGKRWSRHGSRRRRRPTRRPRVVSRGALFGFFALALGAVAAWFGGRAGAVYPTLTDLALLGRGRRRP